MPPPAAAGGDGEGGVEGRIIWSTAIIPLGIMTSGCCSCIGGGGGGGGRMPIRGA